MDTTAHFVTPDTGIVAVKAARFDVLHNAENAKPGDDRTLKGARLSKQPMGLTPPKPVIARSTTDRFRIYAAA